MKEKTMKTGKEVGKYVWKNRNKFIAGIVIGAAITAKVISNRRA